MTHVKPEQKYYYTLSHFSTDPFDIKLYGELRKEVRFTSLSDANMALLDYFLVHTRTKIVAAAPASQILNKPAVSDNFVALETIPGLKNPTFVHMRSDSVQTGEIGWAFDTDGCLALFTAVIVDNQCKGDTMFVEEIKGDLGSESTMETVE
jgi:hypothetical protein